jgi:hypothetical protein
MKSIFYKLIIRTRRTLWAFIVAYMLGVHNFYKGEDKALDDIVKTPYTIEHNEVQENDTPKD